MTGRWARDPVEGDVWLPDPEVTPLAGPERVAEETLDRERRALELRRAGHTYASIAKEIGVYGKADAWMIVRRALARSLSMSPTDVRMGRQGVEAEPAKAEGVVLTPVEIRRLWSKVNKTDTCWLWTAERNRGGYGQMRVTRSGKRIQVAVHRLTFALAGREIPDGLVLDHLCRVRNCVNPDHLRVVTTAENVLIGIGVTAINARKTHCIHGHEFTPENTGRDRNGRRCRTCVRERQRKYRAKKKARSATPPKGWKASPLLGFGTKGDEEK